MSSLEAALHEARSALRAHELGHLALRHRVCLMHLVGDPTIINRIFLHCAKQVYPLWFADNAYDSTVLEIIKTAESHLNGDAKDLASLTALADRSRNNIEGAAEISAMAGMSATSLCYSIANNAAGILGIADSVPPMDDGDFDWEVWNPDFYASIAASGGNPFVDKGNSEKRREFWLWYLDAITQIQANLVPATEELPAVTHATLSPSLTRSQSHNLPTITNKLSKVVELCMNDLHSENISSWDQITLSGECMKGGLAMKGRYTLNSEDHAFKLKYYLHRGDDSSVVLMNQIKSEMYDQARDEGAWLQFTLVVDSDHRVAATFNYDDRDSLPQNRKDAAGLEEEFKNFPRTRAFTPDWWRKIVDTRGGVYL